MEKHWLIGECFVSLTFTVAVFGRETLTVDVKVKKDYFEKLHVLYKISLLQAYFWPTPPLYLAFCRLPFPRLSIRTSPFSTSGIR
jgi:hypothetical protein